MNLPAPRKGIIGPAVNEPIKAEDTRDDYGKVSI
jgi:hypothetical protein